MDKEIIQRIKGGLIVSCQAYPGDPLYGSETMAKMAVAAEMGGAVGIRANGVNDINAIRNVTNLPIIGLIKKNYSDSDVYITPTLNEIDLLGGTDIQVIALDATKRQRHGGYQLSELIDYIKCKLNLLVMADISTLEEGIIAEQLGADLIAPTLAGFTGYTKRIDGPNWELIDNLVTTINVPVIAEGKIVSEKDAVKALASGCHAVCVGTAITRPEEITRRFSSAMQLAK